MSTTVDIFMTRAQVCVQLGICATSLDRWVARRWLPRPMHLGKRVYWRREQIEAVIERGIPVGRAGRPRSSARGR